MIRLLPFALILVLSGCASRPTTEATQPSDHLVLDLGPLGANPRLPVGHIFVDRQEVIQGNLDCALVLPVSRDFAAPQQPITLNCESRTA